MAAFFPRDKSNPKGTIMGRALILWMIGIPIPIIILLALFVR
jgi:hypothetical protein